MSTVAHLWAIGYDDVARADQVRDEITRLGWDKHYLILLDVVVVVRLARRIEVDVPLALEALGETGVHQEIQRAEHGGPAEIRVSGQ